MIIKKSEIVSQNREEKKIEKEEKIKRILAQEKQKEKLVNQKKKVTCRQDNKRIPSLPRKVNKNWHQNFKVYITI